VSELPWPCVCGLRAVRSTGAPTRLPHSVHEQILQNEPGVAGSLAHAAARDDRPVPRRHKMAFSSCTLLKVPSSFAALPHGMLRASGMWPPRWEVSGKSGRREYLSTEFLRTAHVYQRLRPRLHRGLHIGQIGPHGKVLARRRILRGLVLRNVVGQLAPFRQPLLRPPLSSRTSA